MFMTRESGRSNCLRGGRSERGGITHANAYDEGGEVMKGNKAAGGLALHTNIPTYTTHSHRLRTCVSGKVGRKRRRRKLERKEGRKL